MSHKASPLTTTNIYGLFGILSLFLGIFINYILRPDLLSPSIAYSVMGTQPKTKYIFTISLIVSAMLFLKESHYMYNKWQRIGTYLIAAGFIVVALIPISQGTVQDLIHGAGATAAMIGLIISIVSGMSYHWQYLNLSKRVLYLILLGIALSSAVTFILSTGTFHIWALSGYAELSGLTVFAAWVLIDYGDKFTPKS